MASPVRRPQTVQWRTGQPKVSTTIQSIDVGGDRCVVAPGANLRREDRAIHRAAV